MATIRITTDVTRSNQRDKEANNRWREKRIRDAKLNTGVENAQRVLDGTNK